MKILRKGGCRDRPVAGAVGRRRAGRSVDIRRQGDHRIGFRRAGDRRRVDSGDVVAVGYAGIGGRRKVEVARRARCGRIDSDGQPGRRRADIAGEIRRGCGQNMHAVGKQRRREGPGTRAVGRRRTEQRRRIAVEGAEHGNRRIGFRRARQGRRVVGRDVVAVRRAGVGGGGKIRRARRGRARVDGHHQPGRGGAGVAGGIDHGIGDGVGAIGKGGAGEHKIADAVRGGGAQDAGYRRGDGHHGVGDGAAGQGRRVVAGDVVGVRRAGVGSGVQSRRGRRGGRGRVDGNREPGRGGARIASDVGGSRGDAVGAIGKGGYGSEAPDAGAVRGGGAKDAVAGRGHADRGKGLGSAGQGRRVVAGEVVGVGRSGIGSRKQIRRARRGRRYRVDGHHEAGGDGADIAGGIHGRIGDGVGALGKGGAGERKIAGDVRRGGSQDAVYRRGDGHHGIVLGAAQKLRRGVAGDLVGLGRAGVGGANQNRPDRRARRRRVDGDDEGGRGRADIAGGVGRGRGNGMGALGQGGHRGEAPGAGAIGNDRPEEAVGRRDDGDGGVRFGRAGERRGRVVCDIVGVRCSAVGAGGEIRRARRARRGVVERIGFVGRRLRDHERRASRRCRDGRRRG